MITNLTTTRTSATAWKITAISDLSTPTYYWWLDGALVFTTSLNFIEIDGEYNVQVFDSPTDAPEPIHPGRVSLFWERSDGALSYRIDQYVDGEWISVSDIRDGGGWYFAWQSPSLDDGQDYQFRIVPVGEQAEGIGRDFVFRMIRQPAVVQATATLDTETGVLSFA